MAFPQVATTATSKHESRTRDHTVSLPTGIVAGDLLVIGIGVRFNRALDTPAGWTAGVGPLMNGTEHSVAWFYKTATGSEGSTVVVSYPSGSGQRSSHVAYRITGWDAIEFDVPVSGASISADSSSDAFAPSWGSADTLWVATAVWSQDSVISTWPTDYTAGPTSDQPTQGADGVGIAAAHRELTAASEDPGAFELSSSKAWTVATFAIKPAPAGPSSGTVSVAGSLPELTASSAISATPPGNLPTAAVIAIYDARVLGGAASDPVGSWPDLGPKGQAALAQVTAGFQPIISDSDGIRWLLFDGIDDRLDVTLDQSYSGDFALILVLEPLTYPTADVAVAYSTGSIPDKNILGIDDVEVGWPNGAWVTMSGDGTQAEHHHGTALNLEAVAISTRFVMTQLVRDAGLLRLWENNNLVIDVSSASVGPLNNMGALKLGGRENNARFMNMRVGYLLLVDMAQATEAELLAARDDLAAQFSADGFGDTINVAGVFPALEASVNTIHNVTNSIQFKWSVDTTLTKNLSLLWDVKNSVSISLESVWGVRAIAVFSTQVFWDMRAITNKEASIVWDVFTHLEIQRIFIWSVASLVDKSSPFLWDIRESIFDSTSFLWDVGSLNGVTNSTEVLWGVLSAVVDAVEFQWDIFEELQVATQLHWDVNQTAVDETDFRWNVNQQIIDTVSFLWDVEAIGGVASSYGFLWDVDEIIINQKELKWGLNEILIKYQEVLWDVLTLAVDSTQIRWNVFQALLTNTTFLWDVGGGIAFAIEFQWNVLESKVNPISFLWDVYLFATNFVSLLWDVGGGVEASTLFFWNVSSLITVTESEGRRTYDDLGVRQYASAGRTYAPSSRTYREN